MWLKVRPTDSTIKTYLQYSFKICRVSSVKSGNIFVSPNGAHLAPSCGRKRSYFSHIQKVEFVFPTFSTIYVEKFCYVASTYWYNVTVQCIAILCCIDPPTSTDEDSQVKRNEDNSVAVWHSFKIANNHLLQMKSNNECQAKNKQ